MKRLSILVVEDEILIAETIKSYLQERGHKVVAIAISYEEAIEAYKLNEPDLILLDIRLYGEKSGLDFGAYLNGLNSPTPFIFLTSQYDKRIVNQALKIKPSGYLTKPISKETLWTTVESAAQLAPAESETVAIYDGKTNHKVKIEDILYIQADHVYVNIHTTYNDVIVVRNSLHQIKETINNEHLLSCHRSYLINLKHLTKWTKDTLTLNNSISIPLSKSKKNEVLEKIISTFSSN